ncbi:MAG: hypothetical protein AAF399_30475 [Bacteroidota bacterium]
MDFCPVVWVVAVELEGYERIEHSGQFLFNWMLEKKHLVYKLVRVGDASELEIHGLIALLDVPAEFRIHIQLIESANDNKSPHKKMDRVAGCLLSFAVQLAFEKGYNGFTSLLPKTQLISLYVEKYGFTQYGRQLAIEGKALIHLIQQYQ